MKIEHYEFGKITIEGKTYSSDIIVFPDRVIPDWWRKEGHQLCIEDISEVIKYSPEIIVVGTGAYGVLVVLEETKKFLEQKNIKLIICSTKDAVKKFNELISQNKKTVGCFHLTC